MPSKQTFSVVGLRGNGDRVVITKDTTQSTAEQIIGLMTADSGFVELFIAAEDGDEPQPLPCGSDAGGAFSPAGLAAGD